MTTMAADKIKPDQVPAEWRDLLCAIPGYDPFRDAAGCWLDAEAAQLAIDFFPECLRHMEGELTGQPFVLERWQQAIIGNMFGWKKHDSRGRVVRRYRKSLVYVPRKNGKTPMVAGIGLLVLFCDDERGQQGYIAAGEREQAGMLFRQAKGMVEQEPELANRCRIYGGTASAGQSRSIVCEESNSYLRVISADAEGKHGGNTHLAIIDELHVQPNRDLVDVLTTSMASMNRKQPLMVMITTADFDRESICNEEYDYACKVRDGVISDPTYLPVIYESAADDDWTSPEVWAKANPNLGVSVSLDYMQQECKKAQERPAFENTFKRLHLNIRTQQDVRWLALDAWDACRGEIDEVMLVGRECFTGCDLSTSNDITAVVHVFPPNSEDRLWRVLPRFFVPREGARQRERRDRVPYETWAREGYIDLTDGDVIDYDLVKRKIMDDAAKFRIREIAFDPWNATQVAVQLQGEGMEVVMVRQGFPSLNLPAKELERLVVSRQMAHGGNPVLRWMASNVAVEIDAAGNYKPSKKKSTERIDGIAAMVTAMARALAKETERGSVYKTRGLRSI